MYFVKENPDLPPKTREEVSRVLAQVPQCLCEAARAARAGDSESALEALGPVTLGLSRSFALFESKASAVGVKLPDGRVFHIGTPPHPKSAEGKGKWTTYPFVFHRGMRPAMKGKPVETPEELLDIIQELQRIWGKEKGDAGLLRADSRFV